MWIIFLIKLKHFSLNGKYNTRERMKQNISLSTRNNLQKSQTSTKPHTPRQSLIFDRKFIIKTHTKVKSDLAFDTNRDFLSCKRQPLRPTEQKHYRNSELIESRCHQRETKNFNYLQGGQIRHKDIDWIQYNIISCIISQWYKTESSLELFTKTFQNQQHSKNENNWTTKDYSAFRINLLQPNQEFRKDKFEKIKLNEQINLQYSPENHFRHQKVTLIDLKIPLTSSYLGKNHSNQMEVKQILSLIFKNHKACNSNFKVPQNIQTYFRKEQNQKINAVYQAEIIQNIQTNSSPVEKNLILNKISLRIKNILPVLLEFSRKILIKKQDYLIGQMLKFQNFNDPFFDKLTLRQKVQIYNKILHKRKQDLRLLSQSLNDQDCSIFSKNLHQNLLKRLGSQSFLKKLISKKSHLKKINSAFQIKKIGSTLVKKSKDQQLLDFFRKLNNGELIDKENINDSQRHLNNLALKNVNIKFSQNGNQMFDTNRKNENLKKKKQHDERLSLDELNDQFQYSLKNTSLKGKSQKNLKSSKSIKSFAQNFDLNEGVTRQFHSPKKTFHKIQKKNKQNQKEGPNFLNNNGIQKPKTQRKFSDLNDKNLLKTNEQEISQSNTKKSNYGESHKKQGLKSRELSKNQKKLKISPLKRTHLVKFLQAKNKAKFLQNQQEIYRAMEKQKSKFLTTDNSPSKNKTDSFSANQIKGNINFNSNLQKQKKYSERKQRKKVEKTKNFKLKEAQLSEEPNNTTSKIKRLKFMNLNFMPKKIIEMILSERPELEKQKNSIILREKIIAYFNKLLEAGILDSGELSKYKESVQNLMRSYDHKRRTMSVKKSIALQKQKTQQQVIKQSFNINVKVRHDDPYIFQRLTQLQENLQKNHKSSFSEKSLINMNQLHNQINEFEENCKKHRKFSRVQFDLQFSDFFSPIRTKYEDDEVVVDDNEELLKQNTKQHEHAYIQMMKRFIRSGFKILGQSDM